MLSKTQMGLTPFLINPTLKYRIPIRCAVLSPFQPLKINPYKKFPTKIIINTLFFSKKPFFWGNIGP
jgi:hypothetical protein